MALFRLESWKKTKTCEIDARNGIECLKKLSIVLYPSDGQGEYDIIFGLVTQSTLVDRPEIGAITVFDVAPMSDPVAVI